MQNKRATDDTRSNKKKEIKNKPAAVAELIAFSSSIEIPSSMPGDRPGLVMI